MLHPNARAATEPAITPLLVFPSLYARPPSTGQLRQSRQLFYYGFLLLPFLWLLNWCRFRTLAKEARDDDEGVAELRTYVRWSFVGWVLTALLLLVREARNTRRTTIRLHNTLLPRWLAR